MNKRKLKHYLKNPTKILDQFEKILSEEEKPLRLRALIKKALNIKTKEFPIEQEGLLVRLFYQTYPALQFDQRFISKKMKKNNTQEESIYTYYTLRSEK